MRLVGVGAEALASLRFVALVVSFAPDSLAISFES
jgi:hypothetical protein